MRVYDSASNPFDYCTRHAPGLKLAAQRHDTGQPDGPDGRGNCYGYDCDHPDYEGEDYHCHTCGCVLYNFD